MVINEIHRNPAGIELDARSPQEFVERCNPGSESVDIPGHISTNGISRAFTLNTGVAANASRSNVPVEGWREREMGAANTLRRD